LRKSNFLNLFSTLVDFLKPSAPLDPAIIDALDRISTLVDPMLKLAPDFEKQLAFPLQYALGYCDGLTAALPGPIDINRRSFSSDPFVHALFATADDIAQMLGRSQDIRDFLATPEGLDNEHFYALFAARRMQKKQLGMAQHGDIIQNDVPQLVVFFSSQTLVEPSADLETTQSKIRRRGIESLLHTFHDHVETLRNERNGLRADISVERAHHTTLRGTTPGREYEVGTRHLAELDARLREDTELLMPDQLIKALADFLQHPEPALHLQPVSITIDRLGVVHDEASDDINVNTLSFPELSGRDKRLYLAMLARFSRDEALEAVEMVRDQQHRFMLI
jgi:hypothetical protein